MSLNEELKRIETVGNTAWDLVMQGNFRAANRVLKKIRHSLCFRERDSMIALVEAKILEYKGDPKGAKKRILRDICYLWGVPDGLEIIAVTNPKVDVGSSHYYIEILGGLATLGVFTQFSDEHISSFDVVANSPEEALEYISEVANFADPSAKSILTCTKTPLQPGAYEYRGVTRTYPFRLMEVH